MALKGGSSRKDMGGMGGGVGEPQQTVWTGSEIWERQDTHTHSPRALPHNVATLWGTLCVLSREAGWEGDLLVQDWGLRGGGDKTPNQSLNTTNIFRAFVCWLFPIFLSVFFVFFVETYLRSLPPLTKPAKKKNSQKIR